MEITNEAKKMLEEVMEANKCDCLKAELQTSCCGSSLGFGLGKLENTDEPVVINGVQVLMGEGVMERAETITITVENGEIGIKDAAESGCSSSGCSSSGCSC